MLRSTCQRKAYSALITVSPPENPHPTVQINQDGRPLFFPRSKRRFVGKANPPRGTHEPSTKGFGFFTLRPFSTDWWRPTARAICRLREAKEALHMSKHAARISETRESRGAVHQMSRSTRELNYQSDSGPFRRASICLVIKQDWKALLLQVLQGYIRNLHLSSTSSG